MIFCAQKIFAANYTELYGPLNSREAIEGINMNWWANWGAGKKKLWLMKKDEVGIVWLVVGVDSHYFMTE